MGDRYTGGSVRILIIIQRLGTNNFFPIDFDTGHFSQLDLPTFVDNAYDEALSQTGIGILIQHGPRC
jgi:hypothetical protein